VGSLPMPSIISSIMSSDVIACFLPGLALAE
jgi:hypothetical protein